MKTLYIAIPTMGWLNTQLLHWLTHNNSFQFDIFSNISPVSFARNRIVEEFLKTDREVLMMVDADTIPPEETVDYLMHLIKECVDVATGITPIILNSLEQKANVYRAHEDVEKMIKIKDLPSVPFEVVGCGASCIMITREILEKLPKPYFKTIEYDDGKICSEDLYFCEQVRKVGGKIVAHPGVRCGHIKEMTFY
jgi:hypothetical protein